ncbi:multicopper oxidase domain-containing protein [Rhodococcus chondri]|uniref:Copper-containing nitrite reductase n=1 Tax=Rhodococcus chondri TaxID=3065941 RepID=A0ABU7JR28_9NOCA|nr:multicopper oxidase domain-containing protein [Rhodococcus sp. CC-R104]MEE2031949.1 multicopper oxidase domain-containing protein [Rhodococcus sp. CC-R104]
MTTTRTAKRPKSWHQRAGKPVRVWLVLLILAGLTHPFLPESRWLLVHLFTLGAVTNSIVVWSQTLAERFLGYQLPETERGAQLVKIYLLNAGIVVTVVGVVGGFFPVTVVGAVLVGTMVAWHAISLLLLIRRAQKWRAGDGQGAAEHVQSVWFLVASSAMLPVGAGFGATLAYGLTDRTQAGFLLAHQAMNLLGFLGLAAAGVLTVLYPRLIGMENPGGGRRPAALALMLAGIAILTFGALSGHPLVAAIGCGLYLIGWLVVAVPMLRGAVTHPPNGYAPASITAAMLWLVGSLATLAVILATGPMDPERATLMTVPFLAGFAAQLLFGVMSHLLPTMMGGGPAVVGAGVDKMNRWWVWRIVVINVGLVLWLLPLSSWMRVGISALVMAAFVLFLPVMVTSAKASVAGRRAVMSGQSAPDHTPTMHHRAMQATAALACLALVAAVMSGLGGGSAGQQDASAGVAPTGDTTEVQVEAVGMRFTPETVTVAAGDRLVITVTNSDDQVHDLVLATGHSSGRLAPGESATVDAGIVGSDIEGWCSIVGHRQQGMVFHIVAEGGAGATNAHDHESGGAGAPDAQAVDLAREPDDDFAARDAVLAPAPGGTVHRHTFEITEVRGEYGAGTSQTMWTYDGQPMGPTLRGKLGDIFEITMVNNGTMGHSIDFHAGMVGPDEPMRTINPGEELVYRFRAEHTGVWMYHCATAPMAVHIAAGMFGAVVIDPPSLAPVDAEYVIVQSEAYLGDGETDADKVAAGTPDLVMFNGFANQYLHRPLRAQVGDRIRVWVLAAGPHEGVSFHVVGSQFDTVYKEGAYLLRPDNPDRGGAQALDLGVAQGGFVEMEFLEPGTYTFLNHRMFDADRGATGRIVVE